MAVAFSAVLQTTIPIRPFGRRTRWASLATVSGWVKMWKPNRHVTRSNDSSGKSNFSASIARNVRPRIRRSFAMRMASSTICSEMSMPTTRPSGPTMRAMLIAGSPRPVARSRADSRIFGFTRASKSNPYGSKSRIAQRYDSALSFHARRMDSRSGSSVDIAGGRGIPQGHHPFAISVSPRSDSEPLPAAEEHHHDDDNDPHQDERHDESAEVLLPRERDVHSVCAGDESQRQDDRRDHGERLHDFVQAVAHDGEVDLHQAGADLAERVESVERLDHVIVDVAKVLPRLLAKAGEFAASEFRERVPLGSEVVPKDEEVPSELVDRVRSLADGLGEGLFLQLVDDVLQPVEMGEVRVDEVVQDRVGEEVCPGLQESGIFLSQADSTLLKLREDFVADCDDELLRDEQGELIGVQLLGPHDRPGDDEHDVVVDVDPRGQVLVLGVFQGERMQTEQRLELLDRSAVRVDDVDPSHLVGLGEFAA